jgi:hypothetical protein
VYVLNTYFPTYIFTDYIFKLRQVDATDIKFLYNIDLVEIICKNLFPASAMSLIEEDNHFSLYVKKIKL